MLKSAIARVLLESLLISLITVAVVLRVGNSPSVQHLRDEIFAQAPAASNVPNYTSIRANLKMIFTKGITVQNGLNVSGNIEAPGSNLNLGSGNITAANVIYSLTAGDGVSITGNRQNPTIGISNVGALAVTSIEEVKGDVDLVAGDNVTISKDGNKITIKSSYVDTNSEISETDVEGYIYDGEDSALFSDLDVGGGSFVVGADGNLSKIKGVSYVWPSAQAAGSGYMLANDGSGTLSWVAPASTSIADDSLDFDKFADAMTLDATSSIALGSNNLLFTGAGYIGVGTTNPGFTLDVNGIVNATALYVNGSPYVGSQWTTSGSDIYYTTGNVGIGTTSPGRKLDVAGDLDISGSGVLRVAGATRINAGGTFFAASGSASAPGYTFSSDTNTGLFRISEDNLGIGTSGSERVRIDISGNVGIATTGPAAKLDVAGTSWLRGSTASSGGLYVNGSGNVGIGTTSPSSKLDVIGGAYISNNGSINSIRLGDTSISSGSYDPSVIISLGSGPKSALYVYGAGSSGIANFLNGSTNILHVGSSNVGIGTISPLAKLDVSGTGWIRGSTGSSGGIYVDGSGNVGIGSTSPAAPLDVSYSSGAGIKVRVTGAAASLNIYSTGLSSQLSTQSMSFAAGTTLAFQTYESGFKDRLFINNAGSVGIGTTSPTSQLHIVGDMRLTGAFYDSTNSAGTNGLLLTSTGVGTTWSSISGALGGSVYLNGGNAFGGRATLGTTDNNALDVITNSTAKLTVLANGNVGIGTTSPGGKLEVNQAVSDVNDTKYGLKILTDAYNSTGKNLRLADLGESYYLDIGGYEGAVNRFNSNLSHRFALNNTDVVYMGTTTVDGGVTYASLISASPSSTVVPIIGKGASGQTADLLTLMNSSNSKLFVVNSSGNVGIGTTSPAEKLDILGNIQVAGTYPYINLKPSAWTTPFYFQSGVTVNAATAGDYTSFVNPANKGFSWTNGNTVRMTIDSSGNVGIGTTSPATKLEVVGSGRFSGDIDVGANTFIRATLTHSQNYISFGNGNMVVRGQSSLSMNTNTGDISLRPSSFNGIMIKDGGNVGIGTLTPTSLFQVAQPATNAGGNITVTAGGTTVTGSGTSFLTVFKVGDTITANSETRTITAIASNTSMTTDAWTNAASAVAYTLVGGNRFTVLGNGNVGIGTTSPLAKLDVAGTSWLRGSTAASGGLYVNSSGNVGIGTTNPAYKLDIYNEGASDTFASLEGTNGTYSTGLRLKSGSGVAWSILSQETYASNALLFGTGAPYAMALSTAGNLGIGTTAPSAKLHIVGDMRLTGAFYDSTNSAGTNGLLLTSTGVGTTWSSVSGALGGSVYLNGGNAFGGRATLGTTDNNALDVITNSTAKLTVLANGNVGIGTTSPTKKLDVAGSLRSYDITLTSNTSINAESGSSGLFFNYNANSVGNLFFYSGGASPTELARLTSGGNFGLGTTNPLAKLDVAGTSWLRGSTASSGGLYVNSSGNVGIGTTSPSALLDINSTSVNTSGVIKLSMSSGSANNNGRWIEYQDTGFTPMYSAGFYRTNASTTGRTFRISQGADLATNVLMQIDQAGSIGIGGTVASTSPYMYLTSGNVGIGTISPSSLLDVAGTSWLRGSTASSGGLYVNSSGNVGIGTTTPNEKLVVEGGSMRVNTSGATGYYAINNGTQTWYSAYLDPTGDYKINDVTSSSVPFVIENGAGNNNAFRINSSGNVGIGITGPTQKLEIFSSSDTYSKITTSGTTADAYQLFNNSGDSNNSWAIGRHNAGNFYINQSSTDYPSGTLNTRFAIDPSGNVGIGTTSPANRLHVVSSATNVAGLVVTGGSSVGIGTPNAYSGQILLGDNSGAQGRLSYENSANGYLFIDNTYNNDAGNIYFRTKTGGTAVNALTILGSGNVGIGTTNPLAKLDLLNSGTAPALNITSDSVTSGTAVNISLDGLTTGRGINIESTSNGLTTGSLMNLAWNPSSTATATGDLFKLELGANAIMSGNIFALYNNGNPLFTVGTSKITSALPHEFTAAGDASFAGDIQFTDQLASTIKSLGPLTIESGENYENLDLTLKAYGTGAVVVEQSALQLYSGEDMVFDLDDAADTYMEHNNGSNYLSVFTDGTEVARFASDGTVDGNSTFDANAFDIAEYYPTMEEDIEAGDVVMLMQPSSSSEKEEASYLVGKSVGNEAVLGIVSTKPGFSMGGGSFRSEFCALVNDDKEGEKKALTQLVKSQLQTIVEKEFEENVNTATASADLKDTLVQNKIDELYAKYTKGEKGILSEPQTDTIEDKIATCKAERQVPVALAGRVPVKVDLSEGDIKAGDLLMASTREPGKAAKATKAGWVIGRALEDAKAGDHTVMTYVFISWYDGGAGAASTIAVSGNVQGVLSKVVDGDLDVLGTMTAQKVGITDHLMVGLLKLDASEKSINAIGSTLKLQNEAGAGNIEAFGGKVVMTSSGGIIAQGEISASSISAKQYQVLGASSVGSGEDASVGEGKIAAGSTNVTIMNKNMKSGAKVFVTATSSTGGSSLIVKEKKDGSFVVVLDGRDVINHVSTDITFDYWIVGVK